MTLKTLFILLIFPLGMVACATLQPSSSNQQPAKRFIEDPQQDEAVTKAYGPDPNEKANGAYYADKSPVLSSMGFLMRITPNSSSGQRISDENDEGSVCLYCRHQL